MKLRKITMSITDAITQIFEAAARGVRELGRPPDLVVSDELGQALDKIFADDRKNAQPLTPELMAEMTKDLNEFLAANARKRFFNR